MNISAIQGTIPTFGAKLKRNEDTVQLVRSMTLPELESFRQSLYKLNKLENKDTLEIVRQPVEEQKEAEKKEKPSLFSRVINKLFGEEDNTEKIKYVLVNRDNENAKSMDMTNSFSWIKGSAGTIWTKKICDALKYVADGCAQEQGLLFEDKAEDDASDHGEYPFLKHDLRDCIYESDERLLYQNNRTVRQAVQEIEIREEILDMLK